MIEAFKKMNFDNLLNSVLNLIQSNDQINSLEAARLFNVDHQKIVGIIKSLEIQPDFIKSEIVNQTHWKVCEEGEYIIQNGSHEANVFAAIPKEGIDFNQLMNSFEDKTAAKLGFNKAMSFKWILIEKQNNQQKVIKKVDKIVDSVKNDLMLINNNHHEKVAENVKKDLKKRNLIEQVQIKSYNVTKGSQFKTKMEKQETDLTSVMILKGTWKDKKFKTYNFDAKGISFERGHLHPLSKVKGQFCQIFLELGFQEMPTNNYVESSFWNFDALFQPQQHPARDVHDTFFLSDPQYCNEVPDDYLEKVKKVHSVGGYGSQGYKYDWKLIEAKKNLLRTHTTAVSARMLYHLAERYRKDSSAEFVPVKFFSIDKVFRNESLDATHLAEFSQIEGVIADVGLTLGDLMGVLKIFFEKLGITNLKFKPAYNPYTEPSMEVFSYHEGLKKWIEIGNSGMFRPELLLPMGLPENVTVIAWGLSLERPTMIKYKLSNIREIVGHKIDLETIYNNPICILDN